MKKLVLIICVVLCMTSGKIWAQYCPCTNAGGTCITNVSLNTLNNTTACAGVPGNYTQQAATTTLTQGASYTVSVICQSNAIVSVWIDYNHNFQFEATEWVQPMTSATSGSAIIAVPAGAVPGVTGMRVRSRIANLQNGPTDACLTMGSGETEDYNVTIISTTPCSGTPVAGATTVNNANPCIGQQVLLGITGNVSFGSTNYQWIQSPTGNSGTWVIIPGANSPFYQTSLTGNTCFRCVVTCTVSNAFDTSTSICINPGVYTPLSTCYCPCTNAGSTACITNVTFNTLNNTTPGCTGTSNYNIYNFGTNLVQGQSYMFLVSTSVNAITSVWIDYNHDAVFSPSEWYQPDINSTLGDTLIQIPLTSLPGQTRMRVRSRLPGNQNGSGAACIAMGSGETEDYVINILPAANHDPAITALNVPTGNCFTSSQTFSATLTNFGQMPINMAINPVRVYLHKQGPNGNTTDSTTISTGTLQAAAANSIQVPITNVNMYSGGSYTVNTSLKIVDTIGGVVNGLLQDDSLASPVTLQNYRPTPGPIYNLCQYSSIPFGQGLTVSGCATPVFDSVTLTFTFPFAGNVPCLPTSNQVSGLCLAGTTVLPSLPNPTFISGQLKLTNLAQANFVAIANNRFPLFKGNVPITNTSNIFYPSIAGASGTTANFTFTNNIPSSVLSAIYDSLGAGGVLKLGHHHTAALNSTFNGCTFNAGGSPTVATLKIVYSYVPNNYAWFETPGGGTSLSGTSPFNPLATPNNVVNNSNAVGDYIFYVGCGPSPNCRVADTLRINPKPVANNLTIGSCEDAVASNQGSFNLCSLNSQITNSVTNTIGYFYDPGYFLPIPNPCSNVSGSSTVYALITNPSNGCTAQALVNEVVHTLPDIQLNSTTLVCAPASLNASSMIGSFSTIPPNSDTLYFANAACTIPHPNPFNITAAGSVYIVVKTNTTPVCSDTVQGLVNISTAGNNIVNQNFISSFTYSSPTSVDPISTIYKVYADGQNENVYTTDCKKVVGIHDLSNGISMGSTSVDVVIDDNVPFHNGQPYVKRYFKITPTVQDSAVVCLYFLQTDFDDYNFAASGWPDLANPTLANLCISKVDNGDITTPGHTHVVIPNSQITTSYDNVNQVWSACFKVDSFSWFYAHTMNPGNAALSVLWKKFTAVRDGDQSLLNWTTSNEINNDYFQVERSRDGVYFEVISKAIPSQGINGNSDKELSYSYTDMTPLEGHNYYRLLQKDQDGHVNHSAIRDVYFGNEAVVNVFPNPANDVMNITVQVKQAHTLHITLSDASGRIVRVTDMHAAAGFNEMNLNTAELADGMYLLRISDGRSIQYSQSIRKQ